MSRDISMPAQVLAHVIRGRTVESIHSGHVSVVDGGGNVIFEAGDPSTVTFLRSSAKPFQAIPFITSGGADAFGFSEDEIAMAIASHSGETMHVERAARMLEKAGFSEHDLHCGVHLPFNQEAAEYLLRTGEQPTQLHNNCAGKHAAMLAFAKHIGSDVASYEHAGNRIQKRILKCVAEFAEVTEGDIAVATDGCAAPNFAIQVRSMAVSFANLVHPVRLHEATQQAARRAISAMMSFPELIGGTGRLDTMLMQAAPERLVSKVGADGVWVCGVIPSQEFPTGLGIAIKVEDGDDHRGRPVIAVSILKQLGLLHPSALPDLSPMPIRNRRGDVVGSVESRLEIDR